MWAVTSPVPGAGETLWIGGTFFVSASITVISFSLSLIAWCKLKGKDITELDGTNNGQSSFRRKEENSCWIYNLKEISMSLLYTMITFLHIHQQSLKLKSIVRLSVHLKQAEKHNDNNSE